MAFKNYKKTRSQGAETAGIKLATTASEIFTDFDLFVCKRNLRQGKAVAITVKPLWAWAIFNAGKDVENRKWNTKYRGDLLIHASKNFSEKDYDEAYRFIYSIGSALAESAPDYKTLMRDYAGKICGRVELADVITPYAENQSLWKFDDHYGFALRGAEEYKKKVFYRGEMKFFYVDEMTKVLSKNL